MQVTNTWRVALGLIALTSIVASSLAVVYELLVAVLLLAAAFVGSVASGRVRKHRRVLVAVGLALLAGPLVYAVAWLAVSLAE